MACHRPLLSLCRVMGRLAPLTTTSLTRSHTTQQLPQHLHVTHASASSLYSATAAEMHAIAHLDSAGRQSQLTARTDTAVRGQMLPLAIAAAGAKAQKAANATSRASAQLAAEAAGASTEFQVITSPYVVTLADGVYTFALYAIDEVGNAGSTSEYRVVVGSGAFAPQPPSPPLAPPPPPGKSSQHAAPQRNIKHGVQAAVAVAACVAAAFAANGL
jgi:hypothetical protein